MFNWLRNAFSRARDAAERSEIAHRVDQLEFEWHDVLDKLRAREERERKRKKSEVVAAAAPCDDCGPEEAATAPGSADPLKLDMWGAMQKARAGQRGGRLQ